MTNISKIPLRRTHQKQLLKQFTQLLRLGTEKQTEEFLKVFLTESEQVMLIKRLAAVVMLDESYSPYRIARTLRLSKGTVGKFHQQYSEGLFDEMLLLTRKKAFNKKQFWDTLEVLLRGGLPPRTKDKWKYVPGMGG